MNGELYFYRCKKLGICFPSGAECPACRRKKLDAQGSRQSYERRRVGMPGRGHAGFSCALAIAALLLPGCASMNQKCSYYADGRLESYRLRSAVVGTGETEVVSTDCAAIAYSTKDTGLSISAAERRNEMKSQN